MSAKKRISKSKKARKVESQLLKNTDYAKIPFGFGGMYERAKSSSCICISHTGPSVIPSRGRLVALSVVDVSSFFIDV